MGKTWVGVTVLLALGVATASAGADLTVLDLAWPASTKSVATRGDTKVYDQAKGDKIGKIAKGRRLAYKRIVATKDKCKAWLEIEPRGWVCAKDVVPSDQPPSFDAKADEPDSRFADIRGDSAPAYRSKAAIKRGTVSQLVPGETFVAVRPKAIKVGGVKYHKTDKGFIAASKLRFLEPSEFQGLELVAHPPTSWPFAWASPAKKAGTVAVRAALRTHGGRAGAVRILTVVALLRGVAPAPYVLSEGRAKRGRVEGLFLHQG